MIITEAELRVALGLQSTITDAQRSLITMIIPAACNRVKKHLQYDPEQQELTEFYPRFDPGGGVARDEADGGTWSTNAARTQAMFRESNRRGNSLQLERLPIRSVSSVIVDTSGRHGQASGAFTASAAWTAGNEYWIEFERSYTGSTTIGLASTGCLMAWGTWPREPGTIKVTYRAGYSQIELAGRATVDATDDDGDITMRSVDASGIKRAGLMTAVKAFHEWQVYLQRAGVGFAPGPLKSENAGDYSYSLGDGSPMNLSVALPTEAAEELEPYLNYGSLRL